MHADPASEQAYGGEGELSACERNHDVVSARTITDLIILTKPRVTVLVVATMLSAMWVGSRSVHATLLSSSGGVANASTDGRIPIVRLLLALLGTVLVVSGANALNMYIERDTDRLMART